MTEQTGLARRDEALPATAAQMAAIDPARMGAQLDNVEAFFKAQMKRGVHYGTIPGVEKPFLWKSGAELLAALFAFGVRAKRDKDLSVIDRSAELIEITYEAVVFGRQTGADVWTADGFASSAEKCFRNREGKLANDFGTSIRNVCARAEKRAKVRAIAEATGVTGFFLTPDTWEQEEDAKRHATGDERVCPECGSPVKLIPAGISKKGPRQGQPYDAFFACQNDKCTGGQNAKPWTGREPTVLVDGNGDDTPSEDPNAPGTESEASAVPRVGVATVLDMLLVEGSKGKQMATLAKAAKACGLTISGGDPAKWLEGQTDADLGKIVDALDAQVTE